VAEEAFRLKSAPVTMITKHFALNDPTQIYYIKACSVQLS